MIIYRQYNLSMPEDWSHFMRLKIDFLRLLKNAYGAEYYGDEIYESKLLKKNLIIICAIDTDFGEKLVGLLLIKSHEKLSGLAVLKEYRRNKIATLLLQKAMREFDYLYGEVAVKSDYMEMFFLKLGFVMVNDEEVIKKLLTKQKDEVCFVDRNHNYISYIHAKDKKNIDRLVKFMIFEFRKFS